MEFSNLLFAFSLTFFAGMSTAIGSLMAMFTKTTNTKFLAGSLGFSAGVMLYVSFVQIFPTANESLTSYLGEPLGSWATVGGFFFGILVIGLIDRFIPEQQNPHEVRTVEEICEAGDEECLQRRTTSKSELMRMGVFTALALAIHNFPEGLATFTAAIADPSLGIPIAVAIALHNIPEGIAVAVPIFYATGDRKKAFKLSVLSGLSEPVGAIVGYALLYQFFNDAVFGFIFSSVAGIMVYISLDELLPSARKYGEGHISIYGLVAGMAVMAVSLLLFI